MGERYKSFPPGLGHVKVPTSSREAALASIALYTACKPLTRRLQSLAWQCTKRFGPRILPGRAREWMPSVQVDAWEQIHERWRQEFGPFSSLAILERPWSARPPYRFLLLRQGALIAFVKVDLQREAALSREFETLQAVHRFGPTTFRAPEPSAFGRVGEWTFLATVPFPAELHEVPAEPPLQAIRLEIDQALAGLARPSGTPAHWRPMHGDLTPWNLRQYERGDLILFDWENAGWGPPGADYVLYRATIAALGIGDAPTAKGGREAVDFWRDRLRERAPNRRRDGRLLRSLRKTLADMAALEPAADATVSAEMTLSDA